MNPNKWTPAKGWMMGMMVAAGRMLIAAAVIAVIFYLAWPLDEFFIVGAWLLIVTFMASSIVGVPVGMLITRKLDEVSGLAKRSMLLPVCLIILVCEYAAFCVVELLRGTPGMIMWTIATGVISWSLATCVKSALTE